MKKARIYMKMKKKQEQIFLKHVEELYRWIANFTKTWHKDKT